MSAPNAAEHLARTIRERRASSRRPLDLNPGTTYEVVTRQMVDDALRELGAVRQRVDSLFYLVVASIAVDVVMRVVG